MHKNEESNSNGIIDCILSRCTFNALYDGYLKTQKATESSSLGMTSPLSTTQALCCAQLSSPLRFEGLYSPGPEPL